MRDDCVSEGAQLSHAAGYPIRRHHSSGLTTTPRQPGCFCIDGADWFAVAVGVANQPKPLSDVIRPDGSSRNNRKPDVVAFAFQVIFDLSGPINGLGNLFAKDDSRPASTDDP